MKSLSKNNFFYLLLTAFVFIASTALVASTESPIKVRNLLVKGQEEAVLYPTLPELKSEPGFPMLSAQGALAVDLNSGVSLYEKNPDNKLLPASTTKIVTALVALDNYKLDQVITVGDANVVGQKMGLAKGQSFTVEELLYGLLVYSANDAAEVLAQYFPGGRSEFVRAMNQKAKELSMTNTSFQNPVGLDGSEQITTARDLVRVSEVAMRNPLFSKIVGTKQIVVKDVTGKYAYNLRNINELLGNVPGVLGIKTGWTENARENLVTFVDRDGHKIIVVVLGSQDRFGETKELIDWIFENYEWTEVGFAK